MTQQYLCLQDHQKGEKDPQNGERVGVSQGAREPGSQGAREPGSQGENQEGREGRGRSRGREREEEMLKYIHVLYLNALSTVQSNNKHLHY